MQQRSDVLHRPTQSSAAQALPGLSDCKTQHTDSFLVKDLNALLELLKECHGTWAFGKLSGLKSVNPPGCSATVQPVHN